MIDSVVVFGAGRLARCILDTAEATGIAIWGLVDRNPPSGAMVHGLPVIREEDMLSGALGRPSGILVGIGDNWKRAQAVEQVRQCMGDIPFPNLIHPRAYVARSAELGEGAIVLAGAVIHTEAQIGDHVALWSNAVVEHNCRLSDFVTLAPGAILGGNVTVEQRSFIGVGATVSHEVSIGPDVVVGNGAAVIGDLVGEAVYAGCPARELRKRRPGDPYL